MRQVLFLSLLLGFVEAESQTYFPLKDFEMNDCSFQKGIDTSRHDKYSGVLKALKQPSLYEGNNQYPIYRFLWMPSFDSVLVITIHFKVEKPFVEWTMAMGGSQTSRTLPLTDDLYPEAWERIMEEFGFWKDHPMGPCIWREHFFDGSEWLFEGKQNGKYKFVSRSNPGGNSKYFLLGVFFFKAAKINRALEDIY